MKEGVFYVRRNTCAEGSFEWYVLNGHTRRRASNFFLTRAAAAAERAKLQAKLDLAKAQVPPANAERLSADAGWGRGADLRRNLISPGDVSFAGPAPDAAKEIFMTRLGFVLTIAAVLAGAAPAAAHGFQCDLVECL